MTREEFVTRCDELRTQTKYSAKPWHYWLDEMADHDAEQRRVIEQQAQQIARLGSRSHPHEDMNQICELRTEVARLKNELSQRTNLEGSAPCWNSAHMKQIATLREALKVWQSLFRRAVNVAGGLTNYVEDRPELHHAERSLELLEQQAQQALKETMK